MKNKSITLTLSAMLFAPCYSASAQQPTKVPRIGYLGAPRLVHRCEAFRDGLRERGYIEGQNIVFEWRFSEGKAERVPALAAELVRLKVDVISSPRWSQPAARDATSTIPIVMPTMSIRWERG